MKKSKLTLALVVSFSAVMALTACDDVTAKDGVVLTFTDNAGNRYDYKASELLASYEQGSSAASTNFNKAKEVLIRKYYQDSRNKDLLDSLKTKAQNSVDSIKKQAQTNADNNGTTYATEFEKLLDSNGVDNISELFESKLYELEESDYELQFKSDDAVESMKTGKDGDKAYFPTDDEYGRGSAGYLVEKTPYHVSHFLVKFTCSSHNESCQFTITKDESKKISQAVKAFAGAADNVDAEGKSTEDGAKNDEGNRQTFSNLCYTLPSDDTSATDYGNLGLMSSDYVSEFRLGVYAYDALYNENHKTGYACSTAEFGTEGTADYYKDDRTIKGHILPTDTDTYGVNGDYTLSYFDNLGIGTIPYGAAVALGYDSVASDPNLDYTVNDGSATYYARNILFNKYFNNRSIAVIVPETIPFNENKDGYEEGTISTDDATAKAWAQEEEEGCENGRYKGIYNDDYGNLPGFQVNTKDTIKVTDKNGVEENVLTNERGQIILAVKASSSSYEGLHFIVVNRSSLDAYVKYDASARSEDKTVSCYTAYDEEPSDYATSDVTSLSDYFTVNTPSSSSYPKYTSNGKSEEKSTFVNRITSSQNTDYDDYADKISDAIKGYNSSEDTYIFQKLINSENFKFAETSLGDKVEKLVKSYIKETREKNHDDEIKTLNNTWDTYAETLERQNEERHICAIKDDGTIDDEHIGDQRLISEYVALTYNTEAARTGDEMYDYGGIGYDGKK